jgi:hypothetical protein
MLKDLAYNMLLSENLKLGDMPNKFYKGASAWLSGRDPQLFPAGSFRCRSITSYPCSYNRSSVTEGRRGEVRIGGAAHVPGITGSGVLKQIIASVQIHRFLSIHFLAVFFPPPVR